MPKFYFDVYDGVNILADRFGDEFVSGEEAAKQAVSLIPALSRDRLTKEDNVNVAVSVRNDFGEVIYRSISAVRSQWINQEKNPFQITVLSLDFTISHSRKLRAEAQTLSECMRIDVARIFHIIESAAANVEVSRRLLRGDGA